MSQFILAADNLWLAKLPEASVQDLEALCLRIETWLQRDLRRSLERWQLVNCDEEEVRIARYVQRNWSCVQFHWKRSVAESGTTLAVFLDQLDSQDSQSNVSVTSILDEIVLAQAMEHLENQAVIEFERHYMPTVRSFARRVAGERGVDAVDNLASDLILPRGERPPKIASFQGKTSLTSWLRAVVSNLCCSLLRKPSAHHRELTEDVVPAREAVCDNDAEPCERLLRPMFHEAVRQLEPEDRLLIKMLLLDDVPQKDVARVLRIHSGNITRRRQRITEFVWERVASASAAEKTQRQEVDDCLELILAGNDLELRRSLGEALAGAIRSLAETGEATR